MTPEVPDDVTAADLAAYCLMLGDDALVLSHRLAQWCSRAPDLEEDVALANLALDLLGQARVLLARAAEVDPAVVPELPAGSPAPPEDRLAYFRDAAEFRNLRLVELENGDFAETVARVLLVATLRLAVLDRLATSTDEVLAAVAASGRRELAYHRDWAARWVRTLALGTEESHRRLHAGLERLWPWYAEAWRPHETERRLAATGVAVDPATVAPEVGAVLDDVLAGTGLVRPELGEPPGPGGREGRHTADLARLLEEMQSVARAHPLGRW